MTIALRQPLSQPLADPVASDHLADAQMRPERGVSPSSFDTAQEWSFQRMIAVTGGISVVLWLGLGALVLKALS